MARRPNFIALKPFESSNLYLRRMEDKTKPSASAREVNELEVLIQDLTSGDVKKGIQNQPLPKIPSLNSDGTNNNEKSIYANKLSPLKLKPSTIHRYSR
jgi:hypothetical protein